STDADTRSEGSVVCIHSDSVNSGFGATTPLHWAQSVPSDRTTFTGVREITNAELSATVPMLEGNNDATDMRLVAAGTFQSTSHCGARVGTSQPARERVNKIGIERRMMRSVRGSQARRRGGQRRRRLSWTRRYRRRNATAVPSKHLVVQDRRPRLFRSLLLL